jgi:uncharacterized membrane protein (UPF0127 family)
MRFVGDAKTKSAHSQAQGEPRGSFLRGGQQNWFYKPAILMSLVFLLVVLVVAFLINRPHAQLLKVGGHTYYVELAKTVATQEKGLGDRDTMPSDHGMLFVYKKPAQLCFWMKGMRFPLDMLWLDGNKRVVHIEQNVAPNTYPKDFCALAQYVLELNTGQVKKSNIKVGQTAQL